MFLYKIILKILIDFIYRYLNIYNSKLCSFFQLIMFIVFQNNKLHQPKMLRVKYQNQITELKMLTRAIWKRKMSPLNFVETCEKFAEEKTRNKKYYILYRTHI